jgi:hypothetical protein
MLAEKSIHPSGAENGTKEEWQSGVWSDRRRMHFISGLYILTPGCINKREILLYQVAYRYGTSYGDNIWTCVVSMGSSGQ